MKKIPLYILHGKLGAGKTTVLTWMLKQRAFENARIVENEFAGHSVDGGRLHEDHEHVSVYEISGACVCCTGSDVLMKTLLEIGSQEEREMPVIIETTGAVDAARLLKSLLLDEKFHENFVLRASILVVDAVALAYAKEEEVPVGECALADYIVLTKTDLLAQSEARDVEKKLREQGGEKVVRGKNGEIEGGMMLQGDISCAEQGLLAIADFTKEKENRPTLTWKTYTLKNCTTEMLVEMLTLARESGANILRVKGTIEDAEKIRWKIDGTEYLTESVRSEARAGEPLLVLIGENLPEALTV